MDTNRHEFEGGEERSHLGYPTRSEAVKPNSGGVEPTKVRDDASPSKIIVLKETGGYVLREFAGQRVLVTVQAQTAQMIIDYIDATWSRGTKVIWRVAVPFRRVARSSPVTRHTSLSFIPTV